jgi:hypothetical protein
MKTAARVAKVLTFTACREVRRIPDTRPQEYALIAPTINWWSATYPARVEMGLYVEFTEAEGAYVTRIEVHDARGEEAACLTESGPFVSTDPVAVHCFTVERAQVTVPRPGLYDLVLFLNGEEAARRQLWVRPRS